MLPWKKNRSKYANSITMGLQAISAIIHHRDVLGREAFLTVGLHYIMGTATSISPSIHCLWRHRGDLGAVFSILTPDRRNMGVADAGCCSLPDAVLRDALLFPW